MTCETFCFRFTVVRSQNHNGVGAGIATLIVDANPADLEITTRKFKTIWSEQLQHSAASGLCDPSMYTNASLIASKLRPDIRCNEQYNSLIRILSERSRRLGLPLLSSRCNLKKTLGVGTRGVSLRL